MILWRSGVMTSKLSYFQWLGKAANRLPFFPDGRLARPYRVSYIQEHVWYISCLSSFRLTRSLPAPTTTDVVSALDCSAWRPKQSTRCCGSASSKSSSSRCCWTWYFGRPPPAPVESIL